MSGQITKSHVGQALGFAGKNFPVLPGIVRLSVAGYHYYKVKRLRSDLEKISIDGKAIDKVLEGFSHQMIRGGLSIFPGAWTFYNRCVHNKVVAEEEESPAEPSEHEVSADCLTTFNQTLKQTLQGKEMLALFQAEQQFLQAIRNQQVQPPTEEPKLSRNATVQDLTSI
jgi:hypothetical protein